MNKQVISLPIRVIDMGERLRPLDEDYVNLIAESLDARGQMSPIHVSDANGDGRHRLIAGAHRLAAAQQIGWTAIDAIVFSGSDLESELLEIDENLIRRELNDLDRAVFLARRKAIYEELHPQTRHGANQHTKRVANLATPDVERFSVAAAKKLGISERTISRAVARVEKLAPDVRQKIATTWVAGRGGELDALACFSALEQRGIAGELLDPDTPARSVREAAIRLGYVNEPVRNEVQEQYQRIVAAWGKVNHAQARGLFLAHLVGSGSKGELKILRRELEKLDGAAADAAA